MTSVAVCVFNKGHQASLKLGKEYVLVPHAVADQHDRYCVIDESGESYLYPKAFFIKVWRHGVDLERIAFEQWAIENLGQGYPLTMDEHEYENVVTRWAFKAFKAGRQSIRSENA